MTDIPIIFSGPMVRALLDGRKTMTRRLAWAEQHGGKHPSRWTFAAPGDRLWVRESLKHVTSDPVTARDCSVHCYAASIPPGMGSANPYEPNYLFASDGEPNLKPKSIPSIHMPRWASRLTLHVTATKIERLRAISEDDAEAEGVVLKDRMWARTFRGAFADIWGELHGHGSWDANPEVVALTFTVHQQNIDAMPKAAAA